MSRDPRSPAPPPPPTAKLSGADLDWLAKRLMAWPIPKGMTCAGCGVVDARSRESQAVFACVHCGHTDNADVNAAHEILRRSTVTMDAEDWRAGLLKRQPQENAHA